MRMLTLHHRQIFKSLGAQVGPSGFWQGAGQDGPKTSPRPISEYEDANAPPSPNFKTPSGPTGAWQGARQDGPKTSPSLIGEYEDANIPPSPNFQNLLGPNRLAQLFSRLGGAKKKNGDTCD